MFLVIIVCLNLVVIVCWDLVFGSGCYCVLGLLFDSGYTCVLRLSVLFWLLLCVGISV